MRYYADCSTVCSPALHSVLLILIASLDLVGLRQVDKLNLDLILWGDSGVVGLLS